MGGRAWCSRHDRRRDQYVDQRTFELAGENLEDAGRLFLRQRVGPVALQAHRGLGLGQAQLRGFQPLQNLFRAARMGMIEPALGGGAPAVITLTG